jgi:hypothetical protein
VAKFAGIAQDGSMLLTRSDMSVALLLVLVVLACVVAVASWVYLDARAHVQNGTPIVFSQGNLHIGTPAGWFLACAVLFELFIPVYLDSRRPA